MSSGHRHDRDVVDYPDRGTAVTSHASGGWCRSTVGHVQTSTDRSSSVLRLQVRREDVTSSYLDSGGRGPVVVLRHGLAGSAQEMAGTAAALSDRHRVLALDQRGHGRSTRRPGDVSRRACVDDAAALIDTAAGGGPVPEVGRSTGARTALLLATWHPRLVQHLVLLEGGVGGGGDSSAELGNWFASRPVPFPTRQAAVDHLEGTTTAVAWARDLQEGDGGFWPRFDADVVQAAIAAGAETALGGVAAGAVTDAAGAGGAQLPGRWAKPSLHALARMRDVLSSSRCLSVRFSGAGRGLVRRMPSGGRVS